MALKTKDNAHKKKQAEQMLESVEGYGEVSPRRQ